MNRCQRRLLGVAGGLLLDRAFGEPPAALHPVALFGTMMTRIERAVWADSRPRGAAYTVGGVAVATSAGAALRSTVLAVGVSVAGRELRRVASEIEDACAAGDLDRARDLLPSLVGRDPTGFGETEIAAAVVESLAENTVDAVVAPVFWGLVAGAPGALGYRAVNTMDAMVGHKSERFVNFGWASARLDDAANWVPARLFAALVKIAVPGHRVAVRDAITTTAAAHPSPNAGVAEAAIAGAIGRELGGPVRYGALVDLRPCLGSGPRPTAPDISATIRIVDRVERIMVVTMAAATAVPRLQRYLFRDRA